MDVLPERAEENIMQKEDEQKLVSLIKHIVDGLHEKGYASVAEEIKNCLNLYYKKENEIRDLKQFEEHLSFEKNYVIDNESEFFSPIKRLITDSIAILYFNFVERAKMAQDVLEFFNSSDLGVNNIIFAAQEENPDSKDVSMNELKIELEIYKDVEPVLKKLIDLALEYDLLLENNLLGGVINNDRRRIKKSN